MGRKFVTGTMIPSVCPRDCYDTCSLIIKSDRDTGKSSVLGDPTNPITQGFTCPRGVKDIERMIANNRVLHPFIRRHKLSDKVEQVSWNEALDLTSNKIEKTISEFGSETILHIEYAGNTGLITSHFPLRLWNALGTTRTDYSICSKSGHEALALHYGSSYGLQPEEIKNQRLIVFWGFNAVVSSPHMWNLANQARSREKAKIVVIDPRKSQTTKNADLSLHPKPGSDVVLAFGIARYLIEHSYADNEFIERWTNGFQRLKTEIMKWTPNRIEEETGIKWSLIEKLGEAYGTSRPNATLIGLGMQKSINGAESVRAIGLLPAILGIHRGFFYSNDNAYSIDLSYLNGESLSNREIPVVSQIKLGQLVSEGQFKLIYIYNMNPALTLPNQRAFRRGLSRDDVFTVVHETHWNETTDFADIILPAPTFLEKDDVVIPWSHHHVRLSKKAFDLMGQSRTEIWVMQELIKRLKLKEPWLYEEPRKALEKTLEKAFTEGTFQDLMNGKDMILKKKSPSEYQTPSRKIEFHSSISKDVGCDPLPSHSRLQIQDDEFLLLNSASSNYTHTQFREIYGPIPEIVHVNQKDASTQNIRKGDLVILHNDSGSVKMKVNVSQDVPKGVLWAPRQSIGLNDEPQNALTPSTTQKIGNGSVFNSTIVRLQRVKK
jgi:anaerobic selenocysteine-containing dehydrogenase